MTISIRPADLDSDRGAIVEALSTWLSPLADDRRFDWLYRNSPHGQARVCVAIDSQRNSVVGASAAFPRRICVGGAVKVGWVLGDFCIAPHCRSLGPAVSLQRATLEQVESTGPALSYDFPSASMVGVYKRLRMETNAAMVRMAKPLRTDKKIGAVVKFRPLASILSVPANLALRMHDRGLKSKSDCKISPHHGACGEEFSVLARKASPRYGICIERSAAHLNWRYHGHPNCKYEMLTARRNGVLSAYLIYAQTGAHAEIVDVFGLDEGTMMSSLVAQTVTLLRKCDAVTLSAAILDSHPQMELFRTLGFRARESCPVVTRTLQGLVTDKIAEGGGWFLMSGDRES